MSQQGLEDFTFSKIEDLDADDISDLSTQTPSSASTSLPMTTDSSKNYNPTQIKVKSRPTFVIKLWAMVNNQAHENLIFWAPDGKSFRIVKRELFEKHVLPNYFKHSNFTSFVRQLNMYGYKKIHSGNQQSNHNNNNNSFANPPNQEYWEFESPFFLRGRDDLLDCIVRNKKQKMENNSNNNNSNNNNNNALFDFKNSMAITGQISKDEASTHNNNNKPKIESQTLRRVTNELKTIQSNQKLIHDAMHSIRKNNDSLKDEYQRSRKQHNEHADTLNKILTFLASVYRSGHLGAGMTGANRHIDQLVRDAGLLASSSPSHSNSNGGYTPNNNQSLDKNAQEALQLIIRRSNMISPQTPTIPDDSLLNTSSDSTPRKSNTSSPNSIESINNDNNKNWLNDSKLTDIDDLNLLNTPTTSNSTTAAATTFPPLLSLNSFSDMETPQKAIDFNDHWQMFPYLNSPKVQSPSLDNQQLSHSLNSPLSHSNLTMSQQIDALLGSTNSQFQDPNQSSIIELDESDDLHSSKRRKI